MRRLAALAFVALTFAPAAHAATKGPVFGLRAVGNNQRGYFVFTLAPDAAQSGAVIVSNVGTEEGTVKLFTTDATTGRTTGTVYETNKQPKRAGSWVTLSSTAVTLAPGGHQQVAFTVHVPAGTPAGEWVGGIVAEAARQSTSSTSQQKANVQIKIRNLTIVAVESRVPGPRVVDFRIGTVTTGGRSGFQQLFVHFASKGNVLLKPTGRVSVFDSNNKLVETAPVHDGHVPAADGDRLPTPPQAGARRRRLPSGGHPAHSGRQDLHGHAVLLGLAGERQAGLHLGEPDAATGCVELEQLLDDLGADRSDRGRSAPRRVGAPLAAPPPSGLAPPPPPVRHDSPFRGRERLRLVVPAHPARGVRRFRAGTGPRPIAGRA